MASELLPPDYDSFLREVKERIRTAQVRAMADVPMCVPWSRKNQ